MKKAYINIIIFFATIGFIFSFFPSLFAGVAFLKIILRTLSSSIIMGFIGLILALFIDKNVSIDNIDNNVAINLKKSPKSEESKLNFEDYVNKSYNFNEEEVNSEILAEQESSKYENKDNNIIEENDEINYSSIFKAFDETDNNRENIGNESIGETNRTKPENNEENNEFKSFENSKIMNDNSLSSLEKDVSEKKITINSDININESKVIHFDEDLKGCSIDENEKTLISSTSASSLVNSDIESIDQDYIYLKNKKKIENKPEKLAKVIKNMLLEDKED